MALSICGASGSIYGLRLLKALLEAKIHISLVISDSGRLVLQHETDYSGGDVLQFLIDAGFVHRKSDQLNIYDSGDFFAPIASGSFRYDGMVVAPCSMKTMGAIACGLSDSLITRSADVCLKEQRKLILVPRESPLSIVHLENMLKLAKAGVVMLPPMPAFYHKPDSIDQLVDSVVARILDHLAIEHQICRRWGEKALT